MKIITVTFTARHTGVVLYAVSMSKKNNCAALNSAYILAAERGIRVTSPDVIHSFN